MKGWLLDTNVISELRKPKPSQQVLHWIDAIEIDKLFTTRVNLAEIAYGAILAKGKSANAGDLTRWLEYTIRPLFKDRVLEVDERSLVRWRMLARQADTARKPAPAVDLLIAAMAIENAMSLVTRDTKPLIGTGVPVINPWTGERFNGA